MDQIEDHEQGDKHQDSAHGKGGQLHIGRGPHGALKNGDAPLAQVQGGLVGDGEVQPLGIHAHIQDIKDILDDLAKGQGDNGQIVALQTQHGHAHDHAGDTGAHCAHQHGHCQPGDAVGDGLLQGHGGHDAREGAHAHKARVAQGQLPGEAHHQVQGHGHGDIGADGHQLPGDGGGDHPRPVQDLDDDVKGDDDAVSDEFSRQFSLGGCALFHLCHLKLSLGPPCPKGRWA